MRTAILAWLVLVAMLAAEPPQTTAPHLEDVIALDGDTLSGTVVYPWGAGLLRQKIRCLGYDAPEASHRRQVIPPVTDAEVLRGKAARLELVKLIEGSRVYVVPVEPADRDAYGRILAKVYAEKPTGEVVDIAEAMIAAGFGSRN